MKSYISNIDRIIDSDIKTHVTTLKFRYNSPVLYSARVSKQNHKFTLLSRTNQFKATPLTYSLNEVT